MLFNSYVFILAFLPVTIAVYYGILRKSRTTVAKGWLLFASLFFYTYYNPKYFFLLAASTLVNYSIGSYLVKSADNNNVRKFVFGCGLFLNIGSILYFKYYDFFISSINSVFETSFNLLNIVLPLGISFFTFQQISFIVDCYRLKASKYNFLDYALFVSFFPQLIAGPIVLHSEMIPQFQNNENHRFNSNSFARGIVRFSLGLAKKVIIADSFGVIADWGYTNFNNIGTLNAAVVVFAYTFQIYFDFSGYSDMAVGLGKMFNINIPENFNHPYRAVTIVEFWKRWHMTMTRFFREYVYIPLGGNRCSKGRHLLNIFITFTVSGLWHGANFTFIVWGMLHGIAQVLCVTFRIKRTENKYKNAALWALTFCFIAFCFAIFRADSLEQVTVLFKRILMFDDFTFDRNIITAFQFPEWEILIRRIPVAGEILLKWSTAIAFALCTFIIIALPSAKEITDKFSDPKWYHSVLVSVLLVWSILSFQNIHDFLYWNF